MESLTGVATVTKGQKEQSAALSTVLILLLALKSTYTHTHMSMHANTLLCT